MGYKIEAFAWVNPDGEGYLFEGIYGGRSLIRALIACRKAKRAGAGYVRIEWR